MNATLRNRLVWVAAAALVLGLAARELHAGDRRDGKDRLVVLRDGGGVVIVVGDRDDSRDRHRDWDRDRDRDHHRDRDWDDDRDCDRDRHRERDWDDDRHRDRDRDRRHVRLSFHRLTARHLPPAVWHRSRPAFRPGVRAVRPIQNIQRRVNLIRHSVGRVGHRAIYTRPVVRLPHYGRARSGINFSITIDLD